MNPIVVDLAPPRREQLNAALLDAFDRPGLARLVRFNLPYRLDDIVSDRVGREEAVFHLIEGTERDGELEPLLRGAVRANPKNQLLRAFCEAHAPAVLAPADTVRLVGRVTGGLTALAEARADGGVSAIIGEFRATFRSVERQTDLLAAYKSLHDELHNLQMRLGLIEAAAPALGVLLTREVINLRGQAERASRHADRVPSRALELDWIEQLNDAAAGLEAAVQTGDTTRAAQATESLRRLLQEAYRIEGLIASSAAEMQLPGLISALNAIERHLTAQGGHPGPAERIRAGRDALAVLRPQLAGMIAEHAEWQLLSKELAGVEINKGPRPSDKVPRWPRVRVRLEALWQAFEAEAWAAALKNHVLRWEQAATEGHSADCEKAAVQVHATGMNRFFVADLELLQLCSRLTDIGGPLRTLLGE